jgi:phosphoadenosine phosphosulfate reductase
MTDPADRLGELAAHSTAILHQAVADYGAVCYASSLGLESSVLTELIWTAVPQIRIFTVDTGRLFPETYELIERQQRRYGRRLEIHYPETGRLEAWVGEHGINGFRDSVAQREGCCAVRKLEPFRRALAGSSAWVTGIRRGQSASRALAQSVEWDAAHGLHKVSPLLAWSEADVWQYIRERQLPYSVLHDRGFPSIGCAPCTRAVEPGDDVRSGRWWWERLDSRECGLHPRNLPAAAEPSGA